MPNRVVTSLALLGAMVMPLAAATATDAVRMVTATGRAVIAGQATTHEAKTMALEDALYMAALQGGAKIDGFSSVQTDSRLDDHFVVRPSGDIIDYRIVGEMRDDLHYEVTVEAAIGKITAGCHGRDAVRMTMFAPVMSISRAVPGWLSTMPSIMAVDLYRTLGALPDVTLFNQADVRLDPTKLTRDRRYDYAALTDGLPMINDGDFAFSTEIRFDMQSTGTGINAADHLDALLTTKIYAGNKLTLLDEISDKITIKLGDRLPSLLVSKISSITRAHLKETLLAGIRSHAQTVAQRMLCAPLRAELTWRDDRLAIKLGTDQGVMPNRLAVINGQKSAWSILRVTETGRDYAFVEPLNRRREARDLNGQVATFLEMK